MPVIIETHEIALAGIETSDTVLNRFVESFEEFSIKLQALSLPSSGSHACGKIYACVLPLTDTAVSTLKKANWFVPRRTVIYGLGKGRDACRFGHVSMNVLVQSRSHAVVHAAVDATQSLILKGIGQCGRVPIVLPVVVKANGKAIRAITRNIGSGGMAIDMLRKTDLPHQIGLSFVLPGVGPLNRIASPRWYSGNLVGLQLDPPLKDPVLEQWVRKYSLLGT